MPPAFRLVAIRRAGVDRASSRWRPPSRGSLVAASTHWRRSPGCVQASKIAIPATTPIDLVGVPPDERYESDAGSERSLAGAYPRRDVAATNALAVPSVMIVTRAAATS
jgi:hypothetical protein